MTDLHAMLARHAVEIAECPSEHAMAVAEKHFNESVQMFGGFFGKVSEEIIDRMSKEYGLPHA